MELEKAFAEERAVWWTLEERGSRSANASPRGSLTGARALRRGDFASQRSVSGILYLSNKCKLPWTHSKFYSRGISHYYITLFDNNLPI